MKKILLIMFLLFGSNTIIANPLAVNAIYEFSKDNKNEYWWCGHAALASVLDYKYNRLVEDYYSRKQYSYRHKEERYYFMSDIHKWLLKNESRTYRSGPISGCATNMYCSDTNELLSFAHSRGWNNSKKITVKLKNYNILFKIYRSISLDSPLIFPGPLNLVDKKRSNVGHFWIVTGYSYKKYRNLAYNTIYLKDVFSKNNKQLEITLKDFISRITTWRKNNGYDSNVINFLIPK